MAFFRSISHGLRAENAAAGSCKLIDLTAKVFYYIEAEGNCVSPETAGRFIEQPGYFLAIKEPPQVSGRSRLGHKQAQGIAANVKARQNHLFLTGHGFCNVVGVIADLFKIMQHVNKDEPLGDRTFSRVQTRDMPLT